MSKRRIVIAQMTEEGKLCNLFSNRKKIFERLTKGRLLYRIYFGSEERMDSYSGFCKHLGEMGGITVKTVNAQGNKDRYYIKVLEVN